jgi:hypothetical protein
MSTQTSAQTGDQSAGGRASEVKDHAAEVGGTVQEKTSEVAGTAASRATDVASTAKDQALDVAQEAQRQARDLFGEFRGQLQQQTQQQRDRLVELVREFQDELQNMVEAGGRSGTASEVVRQVADRLSGVRSYLEGGANPVDDVRRFARRRPGAFLLLAATAGVLAGRATRGAAAARKQDQAGGRHAIDAGDGYTTGTYSTGYSSGTSAGYAAGATGSYGTGTATGLGAGVASTTGTDYGTGGYGTSTSAYGATTGTGYAETTNTGYGDSLSESVSGYRDQYGEGGTSSGDPLSGVERTSDPNLGPSSGSLTGSDTELGMPDSPVAPEYGGEGVGMPGPNAPTSDTEYDTEAQNRPTYGGSGSAEGTR